MLNYEAGKFSSLRLFHVRWVPIHHPPINNCEIDLREMKGLKRIRGCKIYTTPSIPSIRKLNLIVCHFGYRNCIQIYTISENCIESFLMLFVKSKYYLLFVGEKKDIVKHRKGKN